MEDKLKRIMIKEELLAITNDHIRAIVLNQFLYWTDRVRDFDRFIEEEQKRMTEHHLSSHFELQNGWIFKTSKQLAEEMMNITSEKTIERRLKDLVELGYLDSRQHPTYKWDKTKQYRINIRNIQFELMRRGYFLEGYKFVDDLSPFVMMSDRLDNVTNGEDTSANPIDARTNQSEPNVGAIPEITTETTKNEEEENINVRTSIYGVFQDQQTSINQDLLKLLMEKNGVDLQMAELLQREIQDIIRDLDPEALQFAFKKLLNRVRNGNIAHIPKWFRTTVQNENCTVRQKRLFALELEQSWQKYKKRDAPG